MVEFLILWCLSTWFVSWLLIQFLCWRQRCGDEVDDFIDLRRMLFILSPLLFTFVGLCMMVGFWLYENTKIPNIIDKFFRLIRL